MKTVKEILEAYNKDYTSKLDPRFGVKFPPEKDIPNVINLRRKAIRVFPDGQKIALYYSPQLDKYVSIPYGPGTQASGIQVNEAAAPLSSFEFQPDVDPNLKKAFIVAHRKGGYKPPKGKISKTQVLKMLPMHQVAKYGTVGSGAKKALHDYSQRKDGAFLAGQLIGLGARGLARGATKLVKKAVDVVKPKSTPKPLPESFKEKIQYLREEALIKEEFILLEQRLQGLTEEEQLNEFVPALAGLAMRYGGKKALEYAAKYGGRAAKKLLKKVPGAIKNVGKRLGKKALGALGALGAASMGDSSDGGDKESAYEYAKRRGREATTPDKPVQFGYIDPKSTGGYQSSQELLMHRRSMGLPDPRAAKMQESKNNFERIKTVVENNLQHETIAFGDDTIKINNRIAKKVINLYESLNKDNKKKIEMMLDEDINSFKKIINFAIRQ